MLCRDTANKDWCKGFLLWFCFLRQGRDQEHLQSDTCNQLSVAVQWLLCSLSKELLHTSSCTCLAQLCAELPLRQELQEWLTQNHLHFLNSYCSIVTHKHMTKQFQGAVSLYSRELCQHLKIPEVSSKECSPSHTYHPKTVKCSKHLSWRVKASEYARHVKIYKCISNKFLNTIVQKHIQPKI